MYHNAIYIANYNFPNKPNSCNGVYWRLQVDTRVCLDDPKIIQNKMNLFALNKTLKDNQQTCV
jgi:hypothetical protein